MESNTSLTRSLSKVKSKISLKFRQDSQDEDVLKAMKYDDTPISNSINPSTSSSSSSSTTSSATPASAPTTTPQNQIAPSQTRQNSIERMMEPIPESIPLLTPMTHQRTVSGSTIHSELQSSSTISSEQISSVPSSRKTSLDDKQDDQMLEQLLPPPPMINSTSPTITTELSSPFGNLSPSMPPTVLGKLRNPSIFCDPLETLDDAPLTNPHDFADAMALSILDKVDENTSNTEWKI